MTLATIVILALAAFRATRVVTTDTISVPFRERLYVFAWDDEHPVQQGELMVPAVRAPWRTWAYELFTCMWCLGFWFSVVAYAGWRWGGDVAHGAIYVLAVAGLQALVGTVVVRAER